MEILVSIIGLLLNGILGLITGRMESSAKSEAEAHKKELEGVLDTVDSERRIGDIVKEVERAGIRPEDVFAPEFAGPV